jgi:hypothetical protein
LDKPKSITLISALGPSFSNMIFSYFTVKNRTRGSEERDCRVSVKDERTHSFSPRDFLRTFLALFLVIKRESESEKTYNLDAQSHGHASWNFQSVARKEKQARRQEKNKK